MDRPEQRARAERLLALHQGPPILVLPNAWDVASALVFEATPGCRAIATTSGAIAATLGLADGQVIARDDMLAVVARIAHAVSLPVTADIEAGYGDDPETVARTAELVIEAGAVGVNLEDSTRDPEAPLVPIELYAAKLAAVREAAQRARVPLVINARTDVFLMGVGEPESRLDHAVERANVYRAAGADCLFVPGVSDAETIAALVERLDGPLNVLALNNPPPVAELERMGVARVSLGSLLYRSALGHARATVAEVLDAGTYDGLNIAATVAGDLARLLRRD